MHLILYKTFDSDLLYLQLQRMESCLLMPTLNIAKDETRTLTEIFSFVTQISCTLNLSYILYKPRSSARFCNLWFSWLKAK